MKTIYAFCLFSLLPIPGIAQDIDIEAAESAFRRCKSCHQIADGDDVLQRGGRSAPNLFGIIGRPAGTEEDFDYSDPLIAAGEAGLVWDQENLLEFVANPNAFLAAYLEESSIRSKMAPQRLRGNGPALAAWLETFAEE